MKTFVSRFPACPTCMLPPTVVYDDRLLIPVSPPLPTMDASGTRKATLQALVYLAHPSIPSLFRYVLTPPSQSTANRKPRHGSNPALFPPPSPPTVLLTWAPEGDERLNEVSNFVTDDSSHYEPIGGREVMGDVARLQNLGSWKPPYVLLIMSIPSKSY